MLVMPISGTKNFLRASNCKNGWGASILYKIGDNFLFCHMIVAAEFTKHNEYGFSHNCCKEDG